MLFKKKYCKKKFSRNRVACLKKKQIFVGKSLFDYVQIQLFIFTKKKRKYDFLLHIKHDT